MTLKSKSGALALILALLGTWGPVCGQESSWPDISSPPKTIGGGDKDAAVIVGAENYFMVAKIPGARRNAEDWQAYLTDTLKIPSDRVSLLRDNEATLEKMRRFSAQAATQVEEGGTLWFVFIGHGAPSKDGKDGLLVGVDAQQDPDGLYARSLPRNELLSLLSKGKQAKTVVLIDACFSGRSPSGEALVAGLQPLVLIGNRSLAADPRTVLITAAKSDQFAGPLPKATHMRPAFSYLALGALRGWAADAQGAVTASALVDFSRRALMLDKGRTQTPELAAGGAATVLGRGREKAPNLAKIDRESGAAPQPAIPNLNAANPPMAPRGAAPTSEGENGKEDPFKNLKTPKIDENARVQGPSDAKYTLVQYSDFEDPYCARGYRNVRVLRQKYGKDLRVIYKHNPLPFHGHALAAALWFEAIALQSNEKAWKFHDALFENQAVFGESFFRETARGLGLDIKKLERDIHTPALAGPIAADIQEAKSFGFTGVPGYLLNGVPILGAYPVEHFEDIITKLDGAKP